MTATGHDARTRAIIANLSRKGETRHEVTKLELPPDLAQVLAEMSAKLAQSIATAKDLETRIIALERTVAAITGPILARGAA